MSYSPTLDAIRTPTSKAASWRCTARSSSGRQWEPLMAALSHSHRVIAPDISGYGGDVVA